MDQRYTEIDRPLLFGDVIMLDPAKYGPDDGRRWMCVRDRPDRKDLEFIFIGRETDALFVGTAIIHWSYEQLMMGWVRCVD